MSLQSVSQSLLDTVARGGGHGLMGLTATAAAVLVPITQVQTMYGVTVGYGAAMAAMGLVIRAAAASATSTNRRVIIEALLAAPIVYGVRLSAFLWLRQALAWRPPLTDSPSSNRTQQMPRWKRVFFSAPLALFYACLVMPVLLVVKSDTSPPPLSSSLSKWSSLFVHVGTLLAWTGVGVQAIADAHKSWVKTEARKQSKHDNPKKGGTAKTSSSVFVGPTGGLYAVVRHPNYLGEVTFYTGLLVAALPFIFNNIVSVSSISSALGWVGIVQLMQGATKRLVAKQTSAYGGQAEFEAWKQRVPWTWIPFVKDVGIAP